LNDDRDLRDAFARLRESDLRHTPRFRMPCVRPRRRTRMIPAIAAMLLLVVLSVAYLIRRPQAPDRGIAVDNAISAWRAPTDFLLRTPGSDLTSSVPTIQPQIPNTMKGTRS